MEPKTRPSSAPALRRRRRRRRAPVGLPGESWRPLVGWGAPYEVSDLGRVRKPAVVVERRRVGAQHYRPFLLASYLRNGTPMVQLLRADGVHRGVRVALLVAAAFLPPKPRGAVLAFRSADRSDVRAANLDWRFRP